MNLIQDFVSEVSAYYTEDLARFVPQIWNCRIEFTNAKFIFVTNDKNWVDARYIIILPASILVTTTNNNNTECFGFEVKGEIP